MLEERSDIRDLSNETLFLIELDVLAMIANDLLSLYRESISCVYFLV